MHQDHDHQEFIERLRKSRDVVGYIEPVIVDKNTLEIVVGRHRKEADPNWPIIVKEFKSRKERLLCQIHSDTHRRSISRKERQTQLLELALHLEDEGVSKEKMVSRMAEETSLSEQYIRSLLPKKYKMAEFAPKRPKVYEKLVSPPKIVTEKPSEATEPSKLVCVETPKPGPSVSPRTNQAVKYWEGDKQPEPSEPSVQTPQKPESVKQKVTVTCPYCREKIEKVVCSFCLVGKMSVKDVLKEVGS